MEGAGENREKGGASAVELLKRPPSRQYIEQWVNLLREPPLAPEQGKELTLLIFLLKREAFALPLEICKMIAEPRPLHAIPHKTNPVLRGLINIDGQIKICCRLEELLELTSEDERKRGFSELYVVVEREKKTWVFSADEVLGIVSCNKKEIENVPVNLVKSSTNYLKGIFYWEKRHVAILDDELILQSIKRSL